MTSAMSDGTSIFARRFYTAYPIQTARGIGLTTRTPLAGYEINQVDTTQAKTALTTRTRIKMINTNKLLARCPINRLAKVPTDCPLWLTESADVPKSCTPAAKTVPRTIHRSAGNHPQ